MRGGMQQVPLIGSDAGLRARIEGLLPDGGAAWLELVPFGDLRKALDHLTVELPELVLLSFPDATLGSRELLDAVGTDPWLIHAGFVVLCESDEAVERLEELRDANIVVALGPGEIERQLPRVLEIIRNNRRILFQRQIGTDLVRDISGQFRLGNDPIEARCFSSLISNFLFNTNRIGDRTRDALNVAIYELLLNAIEHGNCGIGYEEKSRWLDSGRPIIELIEERRRAPEVAARSVTFEYNIAPEQSSFVITDEGRGFDWRTTRDATRLVNLLKPHGRGILMARASADTLTYNDRGNQVRFEIAHRLDEASLSPALLQGIETRDVAAGEIVFREGDPGDSLFYIAKGRYDVIVRGKTVACLVPDDLFMGQLSFLLKQPRTATIRAGSPGRLAEISKSAFVDAIRRRPHYALLLSRLLARRVERANRLNGNLPGGTSSL